MVQEKFERIKIKDKDIKEVLSLSKQSKNVTELEQDTAKDIETILCSDCQYPFHNINELSSHMEKHKDHTMNQETNQTCSICNENVVSGLDLRKHINMKHLSQFNCQECDFQASSQIILSKHTNLRHKKPDEQSEVTHKCDQCTAQFSAKWNINNHVRDTHGVKEECKYFKQGRCNFPENICWQKHDIVPSVKTHQKDESVEECYICKNKFKTKHEMMIHKFATHPEKVRLCRNSKNCGFSKCWYRHLVSNEKEKSTTTESGTNNKEVEIEGNFRKAQITPKPPINQ